MTRHHAASPDQGSDLIPDTTAQPTRNVFALPPATDPDAPLICTPLSDSDCAALEEALQRAVADPGDARAIRKAVVDVLADALRTGNARLEEALRAAPRDARSYVRAQTWLTDLVITAALKVARLRLHPNPKASDAERLSVIAVGGYGRAEMAPQSDVDLLFLTPNKVTPWAESVIEATLYILWDLRLKVGHASRTIGDCIKLAREDYTIRTALLEHRFLEGDPALQVELKTRLWSDIFSSTASEFIEAKLTERGERHRKQGGQRYVLEPNVKEGKGGLRDLQTLYWIAKYIHQVEQAAELVDTGMFTAEEYQSFRDAETFLWAVRCHLHHIAKRPVEQLTFDIQVEVAERMRYFDHAGRRGVEHFMQAYFRHATRVGELTRIFLTGLEQRLVKREPMLVGLFRRRKKVRDGYVIVHNRLNVVDSDAFVADPLNLLRIFEESLRTGLLLHPDAMRLIAANLDGFDATVRDSREGNRILLDLMLKHGNPERALRRMNELGVLGAFIPEFENIVAMMQFNVYHHYTVDEHTIQCVSTLAQIEREELVEELPIASRILKQGVNRKVLYVALLLHDIGKGRPEDHSIIGAQIARRLAPRLGLTPDECETVEWLVRYHLLMSDVAQKRDISDPRTVRDFAKAVKTHKRLDLLTVLTVCDIRGVGPGTWNNWKAALLRQLYRETATAMDTGLEDLNRDKRESEAKRALRAALPDWERKDLRIETARHYGPYWQGLTTTTHTIFANMLRGIRDDEIRIDLHPDTDRDATRACFALADHPGIFSRLAGALALVGANVVDARTYTSKDGYATAVFWIQDADGHPYEDARLPRLRSMIQRTFAGEVVAGVALADKDKVKKRERAFRMPTSVTFDNEGSEIYTIIEVDTRDRPGLLFDLTRTLAAQNIYIASAVIATYGVQVVDSFYVKDMFGLKLHAKSKQEALERRLREAISAGAERARR
ncbi:UTP--GlnB (protein PII) uridylyltransferase, GlnD [Roseicitreum antarcticum]|uniref:Bifunctional uridylyltransferase/uridylyl-removing enzyme n=1 Tax=Roseicitreum antarcticum TaxID=564137 RepID=A0A1H2SIC3_9RHOB|nr:[protein-PII] uridylyltransferase [Roseicitreum antarcticum]SDW31371.1 UTP--GlnB (protein PII) uridylyltransferase, GlnD [Roseicitreum antarcticum]